MRAEPKNKLRQCVFILEWENDSWVIESSIFVFACLCHVNYFSCPEGLFAKWVGCISCRWLKKRYVLFNIFFLHDSCFSKPSFEGARVYIMVQVKYPMVLPFLSIVWPYHLRQVLELCDRFKILTDTREEIHGGLTLWRRLPANALSGRNRWELFKRCQLCYNTLHFPKSTKIIHMSKWKVLEMRHLRKFSLGSKS